MNQVTSLFAFGDLRIGGVFKFMKDQFYESRKPEYRIYWAIVVSCGFVLALGLSLVIRRYFHFEFHDDSGIVGWISANKYPKQQEMFYYIMALIGVPLFTAVCWGLWLAYSTAISALIRCPVRRILKQDAFTYLPFILVLKYFPASEPSLGMMLWIPMSLALAAKFVLFCYNFISLKVMTGGDRQKPKPEDRDVLIEIERPTLVQRFQLYIDSAGNVLTAGLCIGFYILITYPPDATTAWYCMKTLLLTAFGALAFWGIYSLLISRLFHRPFQNILACDAYSYIPAVLLLLTSVLYYRGVQIALPILFAFALITMKVLMLIMPHQFDKLHSTRLSRRLLSYLMIPALIYVFFYNGGNIHGGLDLFHEGERLAPLNELLRGGIPFRDVYVQHGLFVNAYRPLLASKLFGGTLASVRFLEGLFGPLGYVCVYLLGLQVFRTRWTAILTVFIASGQNFWVSDRHGFLLVGIAIIANYITTHHKSGLFAGWQPFKTYSSRFLEVSAYCLTFGWKIILAGICTSLAFFYSTEMGLYIGAACGLFLFLFGFTQKSVSNKKRILPLFCYGAGVFFGFLPFAVYFGTHGALDDLIRNSYIQLAYQIPIWGLQFPTLSGTFAQLSTEGFKSFILSETLRWYLPVLLYLIAATYLLHRAMQGVLWTDNYRIFKHSNSDAEGNTPNERLVFWNTHSNAKLLLLLLGGITLFRTALGRSDSPHLIFGATMMWFIGLLFLERGILWIWARGKGEGKSKDCIKENVKNFMNVFNVNISRVIKCVFVLIPIACFLWFVSEVYHPIEAAKGRLTFLTRYKTIPRNVTQTLERAGGIQLSADQVAQVQKIVVYIQSHTDADDTIFDFSSQGAYYFFANRPSATRYHQIAYAATKSMQEEVIRDLEQTRTKLIIFRAGGWFDNIDGVPSVERHPLIAQYLETNYEEVANINGTVILKRKH